MIRPGAVAVAVAGGVVLLLASAPVAAQDLWSAPYPGVRRLHRVTPGQDINVLVVDLCAPGVSMRATAPAEAHRTVVDFGALVGAQAVVNGAFYDPRDWRRMDGMAMGEGMLWAGADHDYTGPVAFGAGRAAIVAHNLVAGPEPWMRQMVSGHPSVVIDGALTDSRGDTALCPRNPRTAVGLSADHRTLYLAVVDGRASSRLGMTCNELGAFMQGLGAHDAINLDGGGSSSMWLRGVGVVNHPSDGSLRAAANHLALYATGSGPPGHCPGTAPTCAPRCEGSVLVGADCGRGDCGAFGSRCVSDALGARCAFVFCPARGEADVCWDRTRVGHCRDGALTSQGDCAAFAAFCSTAGASGGRCVSAFCATGPEAVPVAHDACWITPGTIMHCDASGSPRLEPCPAGQQCSAIGGAHCGAAVCPAAGAADLCLDARLLGHCDLGSVTDATDCSRGGGRCATDASGAHCEAPPVMDAGAADAPIGRTDASAADTATATPDRGEQLTEAGMSVDVPRADVVRPPGGGLVDGGCGCHVGGAAAARPWTSALWCLAGLAGLAGRRRRVSDRGRGGAG